MLFVLLEIGVQSGEFHSTSIGDLFAPIFLVVHAVDVDRTTFIGQVEAAVLFVELAYGSLEPEELTVISLVDEGLDSDELELGEINRRSLGVAVDRD